MKKILSILTVGTLVSTSVPTTNIVLNTNFNNEYFANNKKINNDNIYSDINYKFSDSYNGVFSSYTDNSNTYKLLKWTDYANNWENFTKIYPKFNFDDQSFFKASLSNGKNNVTKLSSQTQNIKIKQEKENTNSIFQINIDTFPPLPYDLNTTTPIGNYMKVDLNIWHDNDNIYFKWFLNNSSYFGNKSYFDVKLNKIFFEKYYQ